MLTENIKRLMKLNKITAKELSKMVGVTPTHISYILNNKRDPSVELLGKIANALGVSVEDIFENITSKQISAPQCNNTENEKQKQIETIAAHLEEKDLTPKKLKLLNEYIDILFSDED